MYLVIAKLVELCVAVLPLGPWNKAAEGSLFHSEARSFKGFSKGSLSTVRSVR